MRFTVLSECASVNDAIFDARRINAGGFIQESQCQVCFN